MAGSSLVEGALVDWVRTRPTPEPRPPVGWMSAEEKAEELQRIQRTRAGDAAREAELILALAADRPDVLDPPPGTPGARRGSWRPDGELPGVSNAFPAELSAVLNCGRGTAVWRRPPALGRPRWLSPGPGPPPSAGPGAGPAAGAWPPAPPTGPPPRAPPTAAT